MSPLDLTHLYDSSENGENGSYSPETMDLDDEVMTLFLGGGMAVQNGHGYKEGKVIAEDDEEDDPSQEAAEATEWPKPIPQFIAAQLKTSTKCRVRRENEDDPSNPLVNSLTK
ncbi:MAG: hypothetical protein M1813_004105 [Trichoglossum hirsutum]|nr:MAG: hypothetical protein M1813_004105 [Trichoglossum hirsutum]